MRKLLLLLALALPLYARSLHWRTFDVEAHLDRDGRLHVRERQAMVFDGDWNGGERSFNLRSRQSLTIDGVTRVDGGVVTPLQKGSLDFVDQWDFAGSDNVIRWRSRMPSDPPFENRELTYVIEVTYSNILEPLDDGSYRLDHDFGMSDRNGPIERYTLNLTFDPIWYGAEPARLEQNNVVPGEGAVVTRTLRYAGAARPAGVEKRTPKWVGRTAVLLFVAGVAFFVLRVLAQERGRGRFAPVVAKLDEEVLALQPEVAGAAWDRKVGPAEVAAVLARLAQEKKIATHVEGKKTLHMKLLVDRSDLEGYERALVSAMFVNGDSTDTDAIRRHYASSGFDPAEKIRNGVEARLGALRAWTGDDHQMSVKTHVWSILGALALLIGSIFVAMTEAEITFVFLTAIVGAIFCGIGCGIAKALSKSIVRGPIGLLFFPLLFLAIGTLPFVIASLKAGALGIHPPLLFAQLLWSLAWARLMTELLQVRDSVQRIAFRKRIAGLRQYFINELARPQPALRDAWYPHLLAFGLGHNVDRWFRSHAAPAAGTDTTSSWSSSSSSSSSFSGSSSPSTGWTGGGGAFGGAGASGSWAVAAAGMASGVAAPSSSGSGGGGGGGGGGSSSGGGGGGGW